MRRSVIILALALVVTVECRNTVWSKEADVQLMRDKDMFAVGMVLYARTSTSRKKSDIRVSELFETATFSTDEYHINHLRVDCSKSSNGSVCQDSASLPRIIVYVKGEENGNEVPLQKVKRREELLGHCLYALLNSRAATSAVNIEPLLVLNDAKEVESLLSDKQDTIFVYIGHRLSIEHSVTMEALFPRHFATRSVFTYNKDLCPNEACSSSRAFVWAKHNDPKLGDTMATTIYNKAFELAPLVTFLNLMSLPPVLPSYQVDQMVDMVDAVADEGIPIVFVASLNNREPADDITIKRGAAMFRGHCLFAQVELENKDHLKNFKAVSKVVAEKKKSNMPLLPMLVVHTPKQSKKQAHPIVIEDVVDLPTLKQVLEEVLSGPSKDMQRTQEKHLKGEKPILELITTDDAKHAGQYAEQQGLHLIVFLCDRGCPTEATFTVSRVCRSILAEKDANSSTIMIAMETSHDQPPWKQLQTVVGPVLAFRQAAASEFAIYDAKFSYESVMVWLERHLRLEIGRLAASSADEVDLLDDGEAIVEEDDDEVSFSSSEVNRKRGIGAPPPVPRLSRKQLSSSALINLAQVVVVHYASKYSALSRAFDFVFAETAEHFKGKEGVAFRTIDCVNLHDICNTLNITAHPTVQFAGSSVQPPITYRGPFDMTHLISATKMCQAPFVNEVSSSVFVEKAVNGDLPHQLSGHTALTVVGVFNKESVMERIAFDLAANKWRCQALFLMTTGKVADDVSESRDLDLPALLAIKHRDANAIVVKNAANMDEEDINSFISEVMQPSIAELTPSTFISYRQASRPLVILFSGKRLDEPAAWKGVEDFSHGASFEDIMPNIFLSLSKIQENHHLSFCWIHVMSHLGASVLHHFLEDAEIPSLLIIDYEKGSVFRFPYSRGVAFQPMVEWLEEYRAGKLKPVAQLEKGDWTPKKKAFNFLSRWVEPERRAKRKPVDQEEFDDGHADQQVIEDTGKVSETFGHVSGEHDEL